MSFELHRHRHLEEELTTILRQELRKAGRALISAGLPFENVIHDSRRRLKKVRAVTILLTQAGAKVPRKDRRRLKSVARALSRLRDRDAIIESLDLVHRRYPTQLSPHAYGALRGALVGDRDRQRARATRDGVVTESAARLAKTRRLARAWRSPSITVSDILDAVAASYRRSRQLMRRARATGQSATLHRWRKELKRLWYQLRLARPLATGMAPLIDDLNRLETDLGDHHNLVVLEATLRGCRELRPMGEELQRIERLLARMREPLRRRVFALGQTVLSRRPKTFARWIAHHDISGATRRRTHR